MLELISFLTTLFFDCYVCLMFYCYIHVCMYVPFYVFCVLFMCKCVLYYCHWVSIKLQLNIYIYIIIYHIVSKTMQGYNKFSTF
jgi:hypothetical protein